MLDARPDIVTIGGKLCAWRDLTPEELAQLRRRWSHLPEPMFRLWLSSVVGLTETIVVLFGVSHSDAAEYVEEELRRLQRVISAGGLPVTRAAAIVRAWRRPSGRRADPKS